MPYLLPEGADLAGARATLDEHLDLHPGRVRTGTTTFYDTFDGRLHDAGFTLRRDQRTLTLSDRATGETLAEAPAPNASRLFAADVPELLHDVIEMRALTPVAKVQTRAQTLAVRNEDGKIVVRLTVETHEGLRGRLTATPVRGYDRELERVLAVLQDWPEETTPLVDEAVAATGAPAGGHSAKLDLTLDPDTPANEAAAIVFARLHRIIEENLPGTLEDIDTEYLHDLRVAVRRTRSLQRQFKSIYPPRLQHFRDEFKRIQRETGDLRDLDVYLLDFPALRASLPEPMRPDLDPLRGVVETRRAQALLRTRRALRSTRTQDALAEWLPFVTTIPTADETVHELASVRIAKVYRKMVKMGTAIDDASPATDLHELRKAGKELRYLLEFFASLYPAAVIKPFVKTLKGLQDQLGRFQDREVQATTLRELAPSVKHPATVMAMGVLVDRFIKEEALARTEFADRFTVFASKQQRTVVKEHFG
ncbi:MAG TPA: CHAD domain-containing protein [Solirubrobacter sp.]|nr:CHAD domain-containing protein [Solirubrobacter sp.]